MKYEPILAKSIKQGKSISKNETLMGHTVNVIDSFKTIFGSNPDEKSRLAKSWFRFFKIPDTDIESFYINSLLSCGLHDIGKANSGFQEMLLRKGTQVIRHEHLSGLILWLPDIHEWVCRAGQSDFMVIFSSVAGHHLKSGVDDFAKTLEPELKILHIFPDAILDIFEYIAKSFEFLSYPENIRIPEIWDFEGTQKFKPADLANDIKRKKIRKFTLDLRKNDSRKRLLVAVRAALILSDSSGSAIPREDKKIADWLKFAFSDELDGSYIFKNIIAPRVDEIKQKKGRFKWSDFQDFAEELPERALLLAPCGSGKTLAAWRWIKSRLEMKPVGKVIFLYPTRATATEGFKDYVSWAPESDAGLMHGTSAYELLDMFDNPKHEKYGKDFSTEDRMYALGFWQRKVFSATVDQFLGFMQQVYRSVCLLPILADSVIVFDEAHSFDRSLFSALKLFLKNFDVPVLCMTATLPSVRRDDLTGECGMKLFPGKSQAFAELDEMGKMPRYHAEKLYDKYDAENVLLSGAKKHKRILWVVNTVSRCQELSKKYNDMNALCYHSRFKLDDRKKRHSEIIDAFQNEKEPAIAFTTQVCEMSLDLDADILISETAPISSMIQRMGRCNRHAKPGDKRIGKVCFYVPDDEKPYKDEDLFGSREFLSEIDGKTVSQFFLGELMEKYTASSVEVEKYSAFLENGPWAKSREHSLRDELDYSVNAISSSDIAEFFRLRKEKKPIDGLIVPVPKKFATPHPNLGRFTPVVDATHYHPLYGFLESPVEDII